MQKLLSVVLLIGAVCWIIESFTLGRGVISIYIAPVIIVGLFYQSWINWETDAGSKPDES